MIVLILALSQLLAVRTQPRFDYCSLNCQYGRVREHTLCGNKFPKGGGSSCDAWKLGLSKAVKKVLLDKHNEARQRLASGQLEGYSAAADMRVMTWHAECAYIAQRWMDQCTIADGIHDICHDSVDGPTGQNLFWGKLADDDTAVAVGGLGAWFDKEAPLYAAAGHTIDSFNFSMESAHFTQVVWALTTGLGCGLRKRAQSGGMARYSLACNYFPAGNFKGVHVYKAGTPCSACPDGTACSSRYPALCARPGDDYADITDDFDFDDYDYFWARKGDKGGATANRLTRPALLISCLVLTVILYVKAC